jgi:hypothetical protein
MTLALMYLHLTKLPVLEQQYLELLSGTAYCISQSLLMLNLAFHPLTKSKIGLVEGASDLFPVKWDPDLTVLQLERDVGQDRAQ